MKTNALLALALVAAVPALHSHATEINVEVTGIEETKGQVLVSVYNMAEGWLKKAPFFARAEVKANTVTVKVGDLPDGVYAFSVVHDVNGNNKMDSNALGIPIEPYGFSNNAIGNFGPPSFEAAKVKVSADQSRVAIKLN